MTINRNFIYIILSILFQSMSIVLGKLASINMKEFTIIDIIFNPYYWGVLICLGLQAIFWQLVLKHYDLSFAYIFINLLYIVILFSSIFIFKEKISIYNILGCIIIVTGIVIFTRKEKKV
ncbi:MAG: hypothetical protein A2015_03155 [Spirochaetes bacterium GWF1_31_7]|nr:MAG: hypothetical protein A2Y30_16615 [Spirochaetes bacterium GWE1_32_154]OHD50965.1 MAG: hypothetical protein A2015_03155 [Spirochaetes bacterium GWF1_31_7]OHD51123.1 MAG: hypothetical protein A2Y29_10985 [Spirochaetes bacterium GWE2_31_10]HBD94155.1 hypothetical protein [Spirochaetia bacterium]HBI37260.1 hypothetical protein [Spirochaetia bacterium]